MIVSCTFFVFQQCVGQARKALCFILCEFAEKSHIRVTKSRIKSTVWHRSKKERKTDWAFADHRLCTFTEHLPTYLLIADRASGEGNAISRVRPSVCLHSCWKNQLTVDLDISHATGHYCSSSEIKSQGWGQGLVLRLKLPRMEIRPARPRSSNGGSLFSGLLIAKFHYTDTDTGPTRTRTDPNGPARTQRSFAAKKSVSVSLSGPCPCPCCGI